MTDPETIIRLVEGDGQVEPFPSDVPIPLNPEDTATKVLDRLSKVTLAVHLPDDWTGPFTLCSRIDEGWNDCIVVDGGQGKTLVDAYYNETKVLDFWVLDENAILSHPSIGSVRSTLPQCPTMRWMGNQKL